VVRRHAITLEEGGETLLTGPVEGQAVLHGLLRRVRDLGLPFESVALGFVTARVVECVFIAVGILSVLAVVTLRQGLRARMPARSSRLARRSSLSRIGRSCSVPALSSTSGMDCCWATLFMSRSALVPRHVAVLWLVGGPLLCACDIAVLFGVIEQGSAGQFMATIPEIL
jgi:hypothetical protein